MLTILRASALVIVVTSAGLSAQTPAASQAPPTPVMATPQNAAAFVGDWDLSGQGPQGPVSFTLSLKPVGEKLTAVLNNGDGEPQTVNAISMAGPSLSLGVTFMNAGSEYPSVVTLTPSGDKVLMYIEVANGLAEVDGIAQKRTQK